MPIIKIGISTQLGYGDGVNIANWHKRSWRRFWEDADDGGTGSVISGDVRWQEAVTAFNNAAVDCSVILGGYLWTTGTGGPTADGDKLTELGRAITISETLDNDIYNLAEYRDTFAFAGAGGGADPDIDDFYAAVGLTDPFGHNQGTVDNPYPSAANPQFYTSEVKGIRLVFMTADEAGGAVTAGALTWLSDTALDTDLPVIILSTDYVSDGSELTGLFTTAGNNRIENYAAVNTLFANAGNVRAVIMGNTGYGGWDGSSPSPVFTAADRWIVDDVDYIPLNAAMMAPEPANNRFYIIEINTDAVILAGSRTRANVKVTTFGLAEGVKGYDQYAII